MSEEDKQRLKEIIVRLEDIFHRCKKPINSVI